MRLLFSPYNREKIVLKINNSINNKLMELKLKNESDISNYTYNLKYCNQLTLNNKNQIKSNILQCIHIILTNNNKKLNYNNIEEELDKLKLKTHFIKKYRVKEINSYINLYNY